MRMDTLVPPIIDQLPAELGFKIAHAVLFIRLAGPAEIINAIAVLRTPFENVPH